MNVVRFYRDNFVVDVYSLVKSRKVNKFKKEVDIYIVNDIYEIKKTDFIDFECLECKKIVHKSCQKINFEKELLCKNCSKKRTSKINKNKSSVILSNINIKKIYKNDKEIFVESSVIESFIGRQQKIYKRIRVNKDIILEKNDYIEFECYQCHKIVKQQVRNNKDHLFQENPICGDCFYKNNILEKYGVDNIWKSKEIKEKISKTNIKKYGVKNVLCKDSLIKERIKKIMFEKYGVYHNFENGILRDKIKKTNLERYGKEYYVETEKFRKQIEEYEHQTYSKQEKELADWISSLGIEIVTNTYDVIFPKELDIYIPSHKLAIEFDGLYWHSDLYKENEYHLNKTIDCEKRGIRLIHIFEDEWINKQDIVKSRLKNILGLNSKRIGARKCLIKEIDSKTKNEFLEKYHIQGKDSSSIKLGAYFENELIGVMTFGKGRKFTNNRSIEKKYELIRFATIPDTYTPGLASKLLTYFINTYEPKEIYSYADRRWSQGNLYEKIGFKFVYSTSLNYWYFNDMKRINRFAFRKSELKKIFPEIYSEDKTEFEIMNESEYLRIFDCGSLKYELKLDI